MVLDSATLIRADGFLAANQPLYPDDWEATSRQIVPRQFVNYSERTLRESELTGGAFAPDVPVLLEDSVPFDFPGISCLNREKVAEQRAF